MTSLLIGIALGALLSLCVLIHAKFQEEREEEEFQKWKRSFEHDVREWYKKGVTFTTK